jgi:Mg-chelatase subunit ChlD
MKKSKHTITINSPSANVQIGDGNTQNVTPAHQRYKNGEWGYDHLVSFSTYSLSGKPKRTFRVETEVPSTPTMVRKPGHLILSIDRSGSMYGDMAELKAMTLKLLTLSEFDDANLKVSLISYSSQGDVKLHFKGVVVADIMRANSPYQKEITSLQATAMTCISQSLVLAETLIDDAEVTCIMLHTDGFANDSSPVAESRAIQSVVDKLKKHPSAFVNTIAYRSNCDYTLLASIANQLSGSCVQATSLAQVYDAFYGATNNLRNGIAPALEISMGGADYAVFVSKSARKVLAFEQDGAVQGLVEGDDRTLYRYFVIPGPVGQTTTGAEVFAYARAMLGAGKVNEAKYALAATQDAARMQKHSKALVSSDIAAFAASLEAAVFDGDIGTPSGVFGLGATGPSILKVFEVLNKYDVEVNREFLAAGYVRRGVRRVPGSRQADGSVILPLVESRSRQNDGWAKVRGFEMARNTANVNMLVTDSIDLVSFGSDERISSVAGVDLRDLKSFNNYTVVGDGVLNVAALLLRTSDKRVFAELLKLGAVSGKYVPSEPFVLDLSALSLVDYDEDFAALNPADLLSLAQCSVRQKIYEGVLKGTSETLTDEQVAELKKVYLTPSLNFSPPTMNEFADMKLAMAQGKVDTRLSYKIEIGLPWLTSMSKLKSGNEYLQRRFEVEGAETPSLLHLRGEGRWTEKALSSRVKLDKVDDLSFPIYQDTMKDLAGASEDYIQDKRRAGQAAIDAIYSQLRPLVFYIGATGLVPDSLQATAMTGEQLMAKFPEAKLSKAEMAEGTFFVTPSGVVITVYVTSEPFAVQGPLLTAMDTTKLAQGTSAAKARVSKTKAKGTSATV